MQRFLGLFSLTFALILLPQTQVFAGPYKVDGASHIKIDVYHPAKHVKAHNKAGTVKGTFLLKGTAAAGSSVGIEGKIKLRVGDLVSGNGRRDKYMRRSLGGSSSHIIFAPQKIKITKMDASGGEGKIKGEFTIHGVTQKVTLHATFKGDPNKGGKLVVEIKTQVLCSSYKIKRPSLMFVKIKDKVDLAMTLHFVQ